MINSYASQGVMLPRTDFEQAESIRDFSVAEDSGVGVRSATFYTPLLLK
jgi:N-acetylglutamate synthase-like GNAT family acetyltransferase